MNGPNLNLVGVREPGIYGKQDLISYFKSLEKQYPDHSLYYFQSNHEGALLDYLHEFGFDDCGVVFNAGAYTHTSIAIADAIKAITAPVIEVHISNVYERETFRHHSFLKENCVKTIVGKGLSGYKEAIDFLLSQEQKI
jgi:3-dehydroquinate dehydratase-2